MKLLWDAAAKSGLGLLCMGLLLFVPAGTLDYPGAWLLIAILFIPMLCFGIVMYRKAPELLRKRLKTKEENAGQRVIILLSCLLFPAMFVLSALDFRFGWSHISRGVVIAAAVVFLAGYGVYVEVMRENAYLSRTVEVQPGQEVIDTGLYRLVRHPMYFATLLLFLSMPLVLGSLYGFFLMLVSYPFMIVWRIRDEEKTLADGLPGYRAYMDKVKYRLLPFIW